MKILGRKSDYSLPCDSLSVPSKAGNISFSHPMHSKVVSLYT